MEDFPFSIYDVASLLNLNVRRKLERSMNVDCPFCRNTKKGKMNLNLEKNVFRCNYCGESGGMVSLYAKLMGVGNSDAYREICNLLRVDKKSDFQPKKTMDPPVIRKADTEAIHQTYSLMLSMLTLTSFHKECLLKRGFTEEQIMEYGYRSTPAYGFRKLVDSLLEKGCKVEGIPGFYVDKSNQWIINFNSHYSGIIIPVSGIDGRVAGAQIRLDKPFDGLKYIWLGSADKNKGTSSGSPLHFVGNPSDRVVYVTEGPLKGTLSHCLSGKTFVCVAGANQHANFPAIFEVLKRNGTEEIVEAYDMDKVTNIHVQSGSKKLMEIASGFGFQVHQLKWNSEFKGIDDMLYAKHCRKLSEIN